MRNHMRNDKYRFYPQTIAKILAMARAHKEIQKQYTHCAWAGGSFFPVVLSCQFLVLAGNRIWFTYSCTQSNIQLWCCVSFFGSGGKQFLARTFSRTEQNNLGNQVNYSATTQTSLTKMESLYATSRNAKQHCSRDRGARVLHPGVCWFLGIVQLLRSGVKHMLSFVFALVRFLCPSLSFSPSALLLIIYCCAQACLLPGRSTCC